MAISAGQFNGNWNAAHDALRGQLGGQEPSSGMIKYAASGDESGLSPDDVSRLGIAMPASVQKKVSDEAAAKYQQAAGSAVSTLQSAGTSLKDQYSSLLSDVLGQGTVAMNTATTGENNLLAQRGITNNSPLYAQQMTQAQLPVTAQNQAAVGALGFQEGQLQTGLAGNIANIQVGAAGTASQLPLQYGQLANTNALNIANIGLIGAQTKSTATQGNLIPIPGLGVYDLTAGKLLGGGAGASPSALSGPNGLYTYVP